MVITIGARWKFTNEWKDSKKNRWVLLMMHILFGCWWHLLFLLVFYFAGREGKPNQFQVLTAVKMLVLVFQVVSCSVELLVGMYQHFRGCRGSMFLRNVYKYLQVYVAFSGPKVEAVCSSKMFVSTYKSTWFYIPEGQHWDLVRIHSVSNVQVIDSLSHNTRISHEQAT